ncbi:MAG TPA: glycosyltransferase [Bacteroidales bacterium]|nr:glycosyltransferase [Bacteroidales bacterium]
MKHEPAVILPVYAGDDPRYFAEALESVLCQLPSGGLLLVVADGPVGPWFDELVPAPGQGVEILRLETNQGLAVALNTGVERVLGLGYSFIARMDADDRMLPGRLKSQAEFLRENPTADIVGCAIVEINAAGESTGKVVRYPGTHEACLRFFRFRDPLAHPAVMFRDTWFRKAGMYDPSFRKNQDTELWYRGFLHGCRFANLQDVFLEYRMTPGLYRSRRGGWQRARQLLALRGRINRGLGYGPEAWIVALGMAGLSLMPAFLRKLAYRFLR